MASVQDESCLSHYRKFLIKLSLDLSSKDLEMLTFAAVDFIPRGRMENIRTGLQLFNVLEQDIKIGPGNMSLLQDMFQTIGRVDLAQRIQSYLTGSVKVESDAERDTVTTDGGGDNIPENTERSQGPSSGLMVPAPAPSHAGEQRGAQALSSGRVQHDPSVGPAPVRYVNFLACGGYTVEIIGGKHFKTPEGEFVELKSGTQYKIHVKNTHAYGCHLDISIDGYDIGGWAVDGGQELSIERPVKEAKKFTFYRVKTAPKEAGIESGRSENGVVKCVFTPEAFLNVPVLISSSLQPLDMNMPPSATVGDLKREVQSQLGKGLDPDQVLVLSNQVLSNCMRLRNLLEQLQASGNLRLIDVEMQITVKTSSGKTFPVTLHPGKAKVHDLMEQIERELDVPSGDQKLYLGSALLSEAPWKGLPRKLICNPQPTVDVKVPEYIDITVEDQNGDSHTVKIDKEKSLTALIKQIPSCSYLQENEEAIFFFNGKPLLPSKDEGTLTSIGLCSGSKLELKVNVSFLQIFVDVWFSKYEKYAISIRCSPEETFKDLVKKVELPLGTRERNLEKVTFAMDGRIFDPEKDKGPLKDYEIKHHSQLQLRLVRPTPEVNTADDSQIPLEAKVSELAKFGDQLKKEIELQDVALDTLQCSDQVVRQASSMKGTKEKKSFLSAIKRKLRPRKHEEMTVPRPPPPLSSTASSDFRRLKGGVAQCGASSPPRQQQQEEEQQHFDEWEDYRLWAQGPRKAADFPGLKGAVAHCGALSPPRQQQEQEEKEQHFDECGDCHMWAQGPRESAADKGEEYETYDEVYNAAPESAADEEEYEYATYGAAESSVQEIGRVTERDPAWRAGGTTLQGYSAQQFMTAEPIKVDPSRKVELVLRLVAREDEEDLIFPKEECKPLSTLYPPAVPE